MKEINFVDILLEERSRIETEWSLAEADARRILLNTFLPLYKSLLIKGESLKIMVCQRFDLKFGYFLSGEGVEDVDGKTMAKLFEVAPEYGISIVQIPNTVKRNGVLYKVYDFVVELPE